MTPPRHQARGPVFFAVTTKSVSLLPQFEHRKQLDQRHVAAAAVHRASGRASSLRWSAGLPQTLAFSHSVCQCAVPFIIST
jgi:hypothetical protein